MNDLDKKADEAAIQEVIKAEEEAALARFRAGRFRERLDEKLRQADAHPAQTSFFRAFRVAVWAAAGALILIAGGLLALRLLRAPAPDGSLAVADFLRRLPGLAALENPISPLAFAPSPSESPLEKNICSVLSGSRRPSEASVPGQTRGFSAIHPREGRRSLQEIYEILVIDGSVERVLTALTQKSKEG